MDQFHSSEMREGRQEYHMIYLYEVQEQAKLSTVREVRQVVAFWKREVKK